MVSDDSVQTLEIFEDFAGSLHSSASCHCNHYNHYYNHFVCSWKFIVHFDFVVSPRPHGPWLISSDDLSFSTRLTILRCISQVWWKWGVSWVVLVSTMVSQNYQNQTVIGWPQCPSITSVCLLVSVCSLFVFASVIDTWRNSRKWGSQAGRQEEQGGGDERGNDFTDSIFCFSFAERTMPHKHFGITWFYLVLCEM